MDKQHLTQIIELFVVKDKRNRFLEFVSSPQGWDGLPKRYRDFLHELLNDPRNIKPDCVVEDLGGHGESLEIIRKLRKLGAGKEAYLVSENSDADGKTGTLEEIVSLVSGGGDIVYCLGTKLGYYEGHENWRYILKAQ
jgi:hypothetical protein